MKRVLAIVGVAALVLASCAADTSDTGDELPINGQSTDAASNDSSTTIDIGDGIGDGSGGSDLPAVSPDLSDKVEFAVADLQSRLGTDVLIEIVAAHELTWPDGSLGCPEPDMSYTQVLVDGYRIELREGTEIYHYHGAGSEDPFLCEQALEALGEDAVSNDRDVPDLQPVEGTVTPADPAAPSTVEAGLSSFIAQAKADLSARRGVAPEGIEVVSARSMVWPDGSLGCPQPGLEYQQVQVDGSLIVLAIDGAKYSYHSGGGKAPFLCELQK